GVLAGVDDLREIGRLAERHGFAVMVDEVYLDLASSGHAPAATLSPAFVSTNSLTKAYGLASLRCGWSLASPEVTEEIRRARNAVDVWSAIPADRLSVVAFRRLDRLHDRARQIVGSNAPLVQAFLDSRPELECVSSSATIAFPRFRDGRDADPFARKLRSAAPGAFFDAPSHFRIAYGAAPEDVEKGLEVIASSLAAP
ncbi:MAG: aminotransferase, partial [Acidobacteria bacterium]